MTQNRNQSEIRRLMDEIDSQYQAAHQALYSFNLGTSTHEFITARMERIGMAAEELKQLVGENEAARIVVEQMSKAADRRAI
jgi:hypothetical protein